MKQIVIDSNRIIHNGRHIDCQGMSGLSMLTAIYKARNMGYPKFYKMDPLCRLGFIGAELLLNNSKDIDGDHHAVVVIGHSGSFADDLRYQETIRNTDNYYPSPAIFVYTLANIVSGEIAIRHKLYGESSSYLIDSYDSENITTLLTSPFDDPEVDRITGGWIEATDENNFSLRLVNIDRDIPSEEINKFFKDNAIK